MMMEKEILIKDYWYELPSARIAQYPLEERDQSKLLIYRQGEIIHSQFKSITAYLPSNCTLFFNNTRVIPARMFFQKSTGAVIELFLLHPVTPSLLVVQAMEAKATCRWICAIGNLKRWTRGQTLTQSFGNLILEAVLVDREKGLIEFNWSPVDLTFAEVVSLSGHTPLPPYLNRKAEEKDKERYQTVYSKYHGAVAAPTAGLHFTEDVLNELKRNGHDSQYLTLHVSAGTFQPVKVENAAEHIMHEEQVIVTRENIEGMLKSNNIIAVGTTSMRTLESVYWYGVKLKNQPKAPFVITQHDPYQSNSNLTLKESLQNILKKMDSNKENTLWGETSIYIMPGYRFRIVDTLITNFHQPGSTLMLLVAAFIGEAWKGIYNEAIRNDYRFLSYGDSSLLFGLNSAKNG